MALVGIFCIALLVLTTVIHYEVLRMLTVWLPTLGVPARAKLIFIIFGAFLAHAAEILWMKRCDTDGPMRRVGRISSL